MYNIENMIRLGRIPAEHKMTSICIVENNQIRTKEMSGQRW